MKIGTVRLKKHLALYLIYLAVLQLIKTLPYTDY